MKCPKCKGKDISKRGKGYKKNDAPPRLKRRGLFGARFSDVQGQVP